MVRRECLVVVSLVILVVHLNPLHASDPDAPNPGDDAAKQRHVLDDMEDVSDWDNGSPEETTISANDQHSRIGKRSLRFGNIVDHTTGEKNYPVGWPRTGKDLRKTGPTDWSVYDFFECWIYAETSRETLPKTPLGVGFYHSGHRSSTHVRLNEVKANAWTKIVIPMADLTDAADVQRVQFNISEADYKHKDRVEFFIDDMVLTRYVHPIVGDFRLERNLLYTNDGRVKAAYELAGYRRQEGVEMELTIGRAAERLATVRRSVSPLREIGLSLDKALTAGSYWAKLRVCCTATDDVHEREQHFRVIEGPFHEVGK